MTVKASELVVSWTPGTRPGVISVGVDRAPDQIPGSGLPNVSAVAGNVDLHSCSMSSDDVGR